MNDLLGWGALIAIYGAMMGVLWFYGHRSNRAFHMKQAAWLAEHEAQTVELARQRHLRELEERRRGLLRGATGLVGSAVLIRDASRTTMCALTLRPA